MHMPINPQALLCPKSLLILLKNILAGLEDVPVNVDYNASNAAFVFENIQLVCRLLKVNILIMKL